MQRTVENCFQNNDLRKLVSLGPKAEEFVIKHLRDRDPQQKILAIQALAKIGGRKTGKEFIKTTLFDSENAIREQTFDAITEIGDLAIEEVLKSMVNFKGEKRAVLAEAVAKAGEKKAAETLASLKIIDPARAFYYELVIKMFVDPLASLEYSVFEKGLVYRSQMENIRRLMITAFRDPDVEINKNAIRIARRFANVRKESVVELVRMTRDSPDNIKIAAIKVLGKVKDNEQAENAIVQRIGDKNERVKMTAVEVAGDIKSPKAVPQLIRLLEEAEDPTVSVIIAESLGKIGEPAAAPLVAKLRADTLVNKVEDVLKRIGIPAVSYIADAMADGNPKIRKNASDLSIIILTSKVGYGGTIERLIQLLGDKSSEVVDAVIDSIINMGDPAIEHVIKTARTANVAIRENVTTILERFGSMSVEIAFTRVKKSNTILAVELAGILAIFIQDENLQDYGFEKLEELKSLFTPTIERKMGIELIDFAMLDRDDTIRYAAAQVARYFGSASLNALKKALKDKDDEIQEVALESLGEIGNKEFLKEIISKAKSKNDAVKIAALTALGNIGDSVGVNVIINAFKDPSEDVRAAASQAVLEMGKGAIPDLIDALDTNKIACQESVIEALVEFGSEGYDQVTLNLNRESQNFINALEKLVIQYGDAFGPILIESSRINDPNIRSNSARLLGILHYSEGIPTVMTTMKDADKKTIGNYAKALENYGEEVIQKALIEMEQADIQATKKIGEVIMQIAPTFSLYPILIQLQNTREPQKSILENIIKKMGKRIEEVTLDILDKDRDRGNELITLLSQNPLTAKYASDIRDKLAS